MSVVFVKKSFTSKQHCRETLIVLFPDHGHHAGNAYLALHDAIAFDDAVEKAVELTSDNETLIIVTADHGHTLTMGGYSFRGNNIFGE